MGVNKIRHQCREHWVAYLDMLGYRELVNKAENDKKEEADTIATLREVIDDTLRKFDAAFTNGTARNLKLRVFSDTIIITEPTHQDPLQFILGVNFMSMGFSRYGYFLRGAVVKGAHYDENQLLFSPAYIEAYDMERKEAFYPRVLVDREVCLAVDQLIEGHRALGTTYIANARSAVWIDDDGRLFLNYLSSTHERWETDNFREPGLQFLERHKEQIHQKLMDYNTPRIRAKYAWLARYHNRFCRLSLKDDIVNQYLIAEEYEMGPRPPSPHSSDEA